METDRSRSIQEEQKRARSQRILHYFNEGLVRPTRINRLDSGEYKIVLWRSRGYPLEPVTDKRDQLEISIPEFGEVVKTISPFLWEGFDHKSDFVMRNRIRIYWNLVRVGSCKLKDGRSVFDTVYNK